MLNDLISDSKKGLCFVENHDNDTIPMIDCYYDSKLNPTLIHGTDFLNNKDAFIKIEDIKAYMYVKSQDHKLCKRFSLHFKALKDVCVVEKLSLDSEFLYKNIPINEKIICYILNKNYNDITLQELKELWISYIQKYCNNFESYIDTELFESTNDLYKTELSKIKEDLTDIKKFKEIKKFKIKEDLIKFWPTLLMPCPSFVYL